MSACGRAEDREVLRKLIKQQYHYQISPEVSRELDTSRSARQRCCNASQAPALDYLMHHTANAERLHQSRHASCITVCCRSRGEKAPAAAAAPDTPMPLQYQPENGIREMPPVPTMEFD